MLRTSFLRLRSFPCLSRGFASPSKKRRKAFLPGEQRYYEVLHLRPDFSLQKQLLTLPDIIDIYDDVQVRDIIALSLQDTSFNGHKGPRRGRNAKNDTNTSATLPRPAPVVIPTGESVIVALGHLKAMFRRDGCHFFDAHIPAVYAAVCELTASASLIAGERNASPFELCLLEAVLKCVCERYSRRSRLYGCAVDYVLDELVREEDVDQDRMMILTQLLPLKDGIAAFTIQVDEVLNTLVDILSNDEDMLGLLLTERHSQLMAKEDNTLDLSMHESVEFLFESYHRQLFLIKHEMTLLHKRVKSREQLAFMALDVYRNSLIRMEVKLTLAALCFAFSTTISGFFGMNLMSGLEQSPAAFPFVVAACSIAGYLVFSTNSKLIMSAGRNSGSNVDALKRLESLRHLFVNMGPIEHIIWVSRNTQGIQKTEFKKLLDKSNPYEYSNEEANMLFSMLDKSRDGLIDTSEVWKDSQRKTFI